MKRLLGTTMALLPLAGSPAAMAAPETLGAYTCPPCPVQSKVPSKTQKGQFDYKLKCTDPASGNSAVLPITAHNDADALHVAWNSPHLDEIIVGLEANNYTCAEPPAKK